MIAQIESRLAADGVARDTYIVFSSDNGLHMGEHRLRPGKLTAFDTDIRVPLIVTGPGVPAGRTMDQMTENVDLCPSFEELAGAPVPPSVDGHGLGALLHGGQPAGWRKEILVEHHGRVYDRGDPDLPVSGAGNPPSYEALRSQQQPVRRVRHRRTRVLRPAPRPVRAEQSRRGSVTGTRAPAAPLARAHRALPRLARVLARAERTA